MKVIAVLDVSDNKRLILSLNEFRGQELIDLRENYLNKEGNYNPTKKGISFNSEHLEGFVKMINKLNDV